MLPKYHILLGFIFSLTLFLIFPTIDLLSAGIIFLSSFLVDTDHYIYYVIKKKKINPKKAVNYFLEKRRQFVEMGSKRRREFYSCFCFLHGIEILVILFVAGIFISEYFLLIFIGFTFHLFLDVLEEMHFGLRLDKISIVYDWIKFKKLKYLE